VFAFGNVKDVSDALAGEANYEIEGILTIKDVSKAIKFNAIILPQSDGSINGQAHFDFDRTLWNVRYGSEKFFEKLGMHLVNDVISLDLFLIAKL
jgi:polyisoprenoid-binding protein YceI